RIVASLGAIALVAIAIFSATQSKTSEFATGTPEATVQAFFKSLSERDSEGALQYFVANTPCELFELDRQSLSQEITIDLVESEITGDSAKVKVRIRYSSNDMVSGWKEDQVIRLEKELGNWRITGTPWPLYDCEQEKP
ncbi:MAG: hypothetical protein ACKO29_07095, partial [Actinomycetota bacterium]